MHDSPDGTDFAQSADSVDAALKAFGKGVALQRRRRGLSQSALSGRIAISQASLSRIESGSYAVSLRQALQLQRCFELNSLEDLFGTAATARLLHGTERGADS